MTSTSSPGFKRVFSMTFNPPAAPTVITMLFWAKAVSNRWFKERATASLTSSYPLLLIYPWSIRESASSSSFKMASFTCGGAGTLGFPRLKS